jgi:microcompartment protein CcmK/EutM
MILGQVVGTVVATQKDEGLEGYKLLLVQSVGLDMRPKSSYQVVVDTVGAGEGEFVITVSGSSARLTARTKDKPVDTAIIAVVDSVDVEGKRIYSKFESAAV